ncbi:sugar transferase [Ferrovum sp. PN-J185]|uniref:sugar transferase n=1 Tax=Ferrovum sp. PN-J185 TaxID=1356306 RepID=UPI001E29EE2B|nr:sugar transferase [Ferrovum sp. PN-J185]MCC6068778.1 sugar transferase [Ferrovum sp. PN-J185]
MKRLFDFFLAFIILSICCPLFLIIILLVKVTSKGPIIHWSKRIGKNNQLFLMPKFRTMRIDTPQLATHLLSNPTEWLTPIGGFLRKTSLDELPQLWSIIKGDMSFVGPRPALFNQYDLIELRTLEGVDQLLPGLTGLAQIKGRDDIPIVEKVKWDKEYLNSQSFWFDLKILIKTFFKVLQQEGVKH